MTGKKGDQMEVQWAEDEKLEEILERRSREGSCLKADVMKKVLELVAHERVSQGEKARGTKEEKKVKVWSAEEMKDLPTSSLEEDTEDMSTWRSLNQEEMDHAGRILAGRMEVKFEGSCKREACRGRGFPLEWRRVRRSKNKQVTNVERRLLGKNLRLVQRI